MVDCDAIAETDTTGSGAMRDLHNRLARAHIRLELARVNHDVLEYLKRDGVLKEIGRDAVFPTVREAVDAVQAGGSDGRGLEPAVGRK